MAKSKSNKKGPKTLNDTESFKKIKYYLTTLFHNKAFEKDTLRIRKKFLIPLKGFESTQKNIDGFPSKEWLDKVGDKLTNFNKELTDLCEKYGFEPRNWNHCFRTYLFYGILTLSNKYQQNLVLIHDYKETVVENDLFFPVVIRISPHARKNTIMDFIDTFYTDSIKPIQDKYKKQTVDIAKFRKKNPIIQEIKYFIIENEKLPREEIAHLVAKKFKRFLDVGHIGKIISLNRK